MLGLRVIADPKVPTNINTNQDLVLVFRSDDQLLYESTPRLEVFRETKADTLSVFLRLYNYGAFTGGRYPKSIAVITGTGLAATGVTGFQPSSPRAGGREPARPRRHPVSAAPLHRGSSLRRVVDDTWTSQELPVLRYLVERFEAVDALEVPAAEIAQAVELSAAEVGRSLRKLSDAAPPYILTYAPAAEIRDPDMVYDVTERARRTVGQWPTAEAVADRLVAAFAAAAEQEPDEERRSWLRRAAAWFGGAGRDFAVDGGAALVARQIGGV
jgi:hypothetical protein